MDVLLATKLHVPGLGPGLVPRPRLTERLDEGLGRGLVRIRRGDLPAGRHDLATAAILEPRRSLLRSP